MSENILVNVSGSVNFVISASSAQPRNSFYNFSNHEMNYNLIPAYQRSHQGFLYLFTLKQMFNFDSDQNSSLYNV